MKDPTFIRSWQRLSDRVTTSGMPQANELAMIAELGTTRVINLTSVDSSDQLPDEQALLEGLGVTYIHLPVDFTSASDEEYRRFVQALEASEEVTHVHCVANWRASCYFYRYHLENGMPENQARALMRMQWEPDASDHPVAAPWKAFVLAAKARAASQEPTAPLPPQPRPA